MDPYRSQPANERLKRRKHFCSMACLTLFYHRKQEGILMDYQALDKKAREMALDALADFVTDIGYQKAVGHYSRDEITALVDTVIEGYQQAMEKLQAEEVPF